MTDINKNSATDLYDALKYTKQFLKGTGVDMNYIDTILKSAELPLNEDLKTILLSNLDKDGNTRTMVKALKLHRFRTNVSLKEGLMYIRELILELGV